MSLYLGGGGGGYVLTHHFSIKLSHFINTNIAYFKKMDMSLFIPITQYVNMST
jgi:hypothetical protein